MNGKPITKLTVREEDTGKSFSRETAEAPAILLELTSGCTVLHRFLPSRKRKAGFDHLLFFFLNSHTLDFVYIDSPPQRAKVHSQGRGTEKGSLPSPPSFQEPRALHQQHSGPAWPFRGGSCFVLAGRQVSVFKIDSLLHILSDVSILPILQASYYLSVPTAANHKRFHGQRVPGAVLMVLYSFIVCTQQSFKGGNCFPIYT